MQKPPERFFNVNEFVPDLRQVVAQPPLNPEKIVLVAILVENPESHRGLVSAGMDRKGGFPRQRCSGDFDAEVGNRRRGGCWLFSSHQSKLRRPSSRRSVHRRVETRRLSATNGCASRGGCRRTKTAAATDEAANNKPKTLLWDRWKRRRASRPSKATGLKPAPLPAPRPKRGHRPDA